MGPYADQVTCNASCFTDTMGYYCITGEGCIFSLGRPEQGVVGGPWPNYVECAEFCEEPGTASCNGYTIPDTLIVTMGGSLAPGGSFNIFYDGIVWKGDWQGGCSDDPNTLQMLCASGNDVTITSTPNVSTISGTVAVSSWSPFSVTLTGQIITTGTGCHGTGTITITAP